MPSPHKPALRIRAIRETKGYTQEYMAEMLDICQSSYAHLESGKTSLSVDRLIQIAEILEVRFTDLIDVCVDGMPDKNGQDGHDYTAIPEETRDVYQQLITSLRSEISFLRSLIK